MRSAQFYKDKQSYLTNRLYQSLNCAPKYNEVDYKCYDKDDKYKKRRLERRKYNNNKTSNNPARHELE